MSAAGRAARRARPAPATIAQRVPFTLGLLALMLACGLVTGALWHPVADSALLVGSATACPPWTLVVGYCQLGVWHSQRAILAG